MSDFTLSKTSKQNTRRRGGKWRRLRRFALGFALLVVLLIGLAFAFRAPLGERLRTTLDGVLAKQGVYVDYGIEDFSLVSGLSLTEVVIFETEMREEPILTLSNVGIGYHLLTLLKDRAESEVIVRMEDSTLSLIEGGEAREITGINAKLALGRAALRIDRFKAGFGDIIADLTGSVEFAEAEDTDAVPAEEEKPQREEGTTSIDLSPVIAILDQLPDTPDGEVVIKGTLDSRREGFSWTATVTGETVNYAQLQLKRVAIAAASPNLETIQFSRVAFEFQERAFAATGAFQPTSRTLTIDSLTSEIDVKALLSAIDEKLGAAVPVLPAHRLSAKGTVDLLELGNTVLAGDVAITEPTRVPAGEKTVSIQSAKVSFAIAEGKLELSELDSVIGSEEQPLMVLAEASMALPMSEGEALSEVALKSVAIRQSDRELTMNGAVDLAGNALQVTTLNSTLNPFDVLRSLGLSDGDAPMTFASGPTIEASGRLPFEAPMTGGLTGRFKVDGDTTIPLGDGKPPLAFSNLASGFTLENGSVLLPDLVTQTMGGEVRYEGSLTPADSVSFDGTITVDRVQLQQIMVLAGQSEERTGIVALTFTGNGATSLQSMNGSGVLRVTEAEFVSVPIYSGLRPLLMAINLGAWNGDQQGTELGASYQLSAGTLASDDILLAGEFYEIASTLELNFTDRTVAATGAVATTGTTSVLTGLVGKLLEVEASGEFGDIGWKLKNAPSIGDIAGLTGKSTSLITDTLLNATVAKTAINLPGNLLKQIVPGEGNDSMQPLNDAPTGAVEAVGGVLGRLSPFGKKKEEPEPTPTVEE